MDVGHLEEAEGALHGEEEEEEATIVVAMTAAVILHEVVIEVATEGGQGVTRHIKSCESVKHRVY